MVIFTARRHRRRPACGRHPAAETHGSGASARNNGDEFANIGAGKMKSDFCHVIVFSIVCPLSMTACSSGGGGVAPATTASSVPVSSPAPAAPQIMPAPTVTVPANFQPASATVTYPITSVVQVGGRRKDRQPGAAL